MRKPLPLTLHPSVKQAQDWADGARFMGMTVPNFVGTCASWGAKYFPTQERAKRPDAIANRVEEKGKLAALLQAATQALQHLPPPFRSPIYGEMRDPAGDLRKAIDGVHEFQAKHGGAVGVKRTVKIASFTVRANAEQSRRWKQMAESEGYGSVGSWLAGSADAYIKMRLKTAAPLALGWSIGTFRVALSSGVTVTVRGKLAPPFGYYEGTDDGPTVGHGGDRRYTLLHLPTNRLLGTFRRSTSCKILAAELAREWAKRDGPDPSGDPSPLLQAIRLDAV